MAQLFVPLGGAFAGVAGSGFNAEGENLDRPQWQGAELSMLDTFPDVWAAVAEAEFHDWIIGVHHPVYTKGGPAWCRFLDPDRAMRAEALEIAAGAAQAAHHLGARYILFHFPWPGLQLPGRDHVAEGWYAGYRLTDLAHWDVAALYEWSRRVFEHLACVQEREQIKIVLELDGPNPHFFEGDLYSRLFGEFPELSLCVDTGRLGLLAKTHMQEPIDLMRRLLPWTRHLHLHTSMWDEQGRMHNHIPTDASHTAERWPGVTPAADMLKMVLAAQPRCTVVLEHRPRCIAPDALEAAHRWVAELAREAG